MTNLKPYGLYKDDRADCEPELSSAVSRTHVRRMVRACLLRDRTVEETLRQVRRVYSNAKGLSDIVLHFYETEVDA